MVFRIHGVGIPNDLSQNGAGGTQQVFGSLWFFSRWQNPVLGGWRGGVRTWAGAAVQMRSRESWNWGDCPQSQCLLSAGGGM